MKLIRAALVACFALSVAACDGILGNDDDNFTFGAQQITFEEGMTNEAEINGLIRTIQVDGVFLLPHPCHNLRGNLNRTQGGIVEITITASSTSTTCPAQVQAMQYRLQTLGFSRGFYRVAVYHEIGGQPRTLINQQDVLLE